MMSVLTALFDEFETLRSKRMLVIGSLVFCLSASSVYFCTQVGNGFLRIDLWIYLPNSLYSWASAS